MPHIENKVNVKYITKNIKTDGNDFFLATTNQRRASINSSKNLRLIATRLCMVWLPGSFVWPLKKIIRVIIVIVVNMPERIIISWKRGLRFNNEVKKYPAPSVRR